MTLIRSIVYGGSITAAATLALSTPSNAQDLASMISPVTNPTNFEDPRNTTELRPIALYHELQDDFATEGGSVQVYALQARFALSEDFSIIATKDGWANIEPNATLPRSEGFANVAVGGKYAIHRDESSIVSTGLRYEIPIGEHDALQADDGGMVNPFVSAAASVEGFNFMAGSGLRIRTDNEYSSFWDLDLHADYPLGNFYPLVEFNLVHVVNDGERLPIADEGIDFFNLGSSGAAGENIITMGVGARYRMCDNIDFGVAYQFPLDRGEGTGIVDWRVTADMIYRFEL